ncbi:hypothetical protein AGMMS50262_17230 [Bacteroidia bacterium]|nr:hypothetical protein AGMMS50262_17230 [Bacteroidia bacterium]
MTKIKESGMRLLLMLTAVLMLNCVSAQEKKATIQFDSKKHDFGTINLKKDSVVYATFLFENKGNAPLIVYKVTTSCGCTVSEWTKEPVESGNKGSVKIIFNPKGFSGRFSKSIYVKSNATEDVIILKIEGEVTDKEKGIFNLF